ncbi:alpha/beta fold hydrolase [Micromonospora sp. NPDC048887]
MSTTIAGFDYQRVPVAEGVTLNVAVGGSGSPVVLLHGFPQTHLMWRHVAADLAGEHTVICPDLRGYGASDKPAADTEDTYSKRTMAADVVAAARALGHERFALAGHDRGALVAVRAGLDHPDTVTHLASLDVLPTLDMWDVLHGASASVAFHLYLMAQPPGLPEKMIAGSADAFFGHFLDAWAGDPAAMPAQVRAEYLRPPGRRSTRSSPTTGRRPGSTWRTTGRTGTPGGGWPCRSPSSSRTGSPRSATTRRRCGGPGPRTWSTAPPRPGTSWPRRPPARSPRRCARC